jgi:large subunit ribosomal protein L3
MSLGLIGKKLGMTKVYTDKGEAVAVTVVDVSGNQIIQVKRSDGKDGYTAVQVGYGDQKEFRVTKPLMGHFKKHGSGAKKIVKEFRLTGDDKLPAADAKYDASMFSNGQIVDVIGTTKGKGFQGVVKRHGFSGVGETTHGQHDRSRAPGSLGGSSYPARVFKGLRMAGRTGGDQHTTENLKVVKIDKDRNLVLLRGSVPGPKGSIIIIWK